MSSKLLYRPSLFFAAALGFATPAAADEGAREAPSGFEIGLRTGYGVGLGSISKGLKMGDSVNGRVPIWLDLGYRFAGRVYVGAYGELAPVLVDEKSACEGVPDCSATGGALLRLGVNAHYHFAPRGALDPWVGLGVGLEGLGTGAKLNGERTTAAFGGWEFALFQVGADYRVSKNFGLGPFASASLGQYTSRTIEVDGDEVDDESIKDKTIHSWLTFGVRGVFDF